MKHYKDWGWTHSVTWSDGMNSAARCSYLIVFLHQVNQQLHRGRLKNVVKIITSNIVTYQFHISNTYKFATRVKWARYCATKFSTNRLLSKIHAFRNHAPMNPSQTWQVFVCQSLSALHLSSYLEVDVSVECEYKGVVGGSLLPSGVVRLRPQTVPKEVVHVHHLKNPQPQANY